MAMSVPKVGINRFMKEGTRMFKGVEEAVQRNIEACVDLSATTRSCYGPNGMSKMVINHLEKLFVTNDAATILNELDVQHPAAKMLVLASKMQEQEIGDGTNAVILIGASLLEHASDLLNMGLKPVEIADGYEKACEIALKALESSVCETVSDVRNEEEVKRVVRAAIMSKQFGNEDILANLATKACLQAMPRTESGFNVDNIRICKIPGASIQHSSVMNGMVFKRNAEGEVRSIKDAKLAVYTCPFDITQTETKGTVLINTAEELKAFSHGEENEIEKQIEAIVATGVNCVVCGGKFGDLYLHHLNKRGVMAVRITSKFDLRRLARSINTTPLTAIVAPGAASIGHCDYVGVEEIGDTEVVVFRQSTDKGKVSTIVLRGASDNLLDDLQRAIDDAVNTVKALTKDGRCVPGGGAVEIEMARRVDEYGGKCAGIEQYPIQQFAMALESLPKQIVDNAGLKSSVILPKVVAAHAAGNKNACVNLTGDAESPAADALQLGIVDLYSLKASALQLAVNAACTILIIDQIVMSKPAGGPKPKEGPKGMDADDPE